MTDYLLLLPMVIPLLFFFIAFNQKINIKYFKTIYFLFLSASIFLVIINIIIFTNNPIYFKIGYIITISFTSDPISILFCILISLLWPFVSIYSFGYFGEIDIYLGRFFSFFMLAFVSALGMSFSGDLVTFFIFYELLSISTFYMIIYTGTKESFLSAKKYIIYSLFGSVFIVIGMIILNNLAGSLNFTTGGMVEFFLSLSMPQVLVPYFILFIGFGIKAALVPLHGWLPESMAAPTPVCALIMEVVNVKMSILALFRITFYIIGWKGVDTTIGNNTILIFVLINITLGSFLALYQKNLKKRLAYSTISQLGYVMLCLVIFTEDVFTGSILHIVFHSLNKVILFLCIGAIIHCTGKTEMDQISGIGKKMPKTMICFTIAAFSLIGIPPANGFVSKWYIATGGLSLGKYFVPVFLLISAFLTAEYLIPIVAAAFFKTKSVNDTDITYQNQDPDKYMMYPIIGLTAISILTGLFPNSIIFLIEKATSALFLGGL